MGPRDVPTHVPSGEVMGTLMSPAFSFCALEVGGLGASGCDMAESGERVPHPVHPVAAPNNCCSVKQECLSRGCENSGAGRCGPHLTLRGTISCIHCLATSEEWSAPLRGGEESRSQYP